MINAWCFQERVVLGWVDEGKYTGKEGRDVKGHGVFGKQSCWGIWRAEAFLLSVEGPGRVFGKKCATYGSEKACCGSGESDSERRIWKQR